MREDQRYDAGQAGLMTRKAEENSMLYPLAEEEATPDVLTSLETDRSPTLMLHTEEIFLELRQRVDD